MCSLLRGPGEVGAKLLVTGLRQGRAAAQTREC
jgi:hypothetical protein